MFPLAVASTKYIAGISQPSDKATLLQVVGIEEAMGDDWPTDAHFVTYRPANYEPGMAWPRINKSALSEVRRLGHDLVTNILAFDIDTPKHRPWIPDEQGGPGTWAAFLDQLYNLSLRWPLVGMFKYMYSSRAGARLVYATRDPIPVDIAEETHRWFVGKLLSFGMTKQSGNCYVDSGCSDWTRVFRLPFVLREGTNTRHDSFDTNGFRTPTLEESTSVIDNILLGQISGKERSEYGPVQHLNASIPNHDEATRLVYVSGVKAKRTDWGKRAELKLRGRDCYDVLFNNVPIPVGERNNVLTRHVGQVVSILIDHEVEGSTPHHAYAIFLEAVDQMEPDTQTPSWHDVTWGLIQRFWSQQLAKVSKKQAITLVEEKQAIGTLKSVINGMRKWCKHPEIIDQTDNNAAAIAFAQQRFILSVGNTYYVIGKDGYYDMTPLNSTQMVPHIRRSKMDAIISVDAATEGGAVRERELKQILSDHATIVSTVEVVASQSPGGTVVRMDTPRAAMQIPGFRRRTDLEPQFSNDVDLWLQILFGDKYPLAVKWIGWALAFEEGPICALSIKAEQGVGKKLLVQGLAECLEVPCVASAADLTSNYQYGLLASPFLVVNEGFPRISPESSPYHVFRSLVSGDPQIVNRRYLHPVEVRCPYRVIFTANNDGIIEAMIGKGNLSPEDRASLAIRLVHMDLGDKASKWLRAKGGVAFTGRQGNRWISGDSGEPSDYVVAKHFMWLYEKRVGPRGARFLVEGSADTDADIMTRLRTQSGSSPLVIETLIKMLNERVLPQEIWVTDELRIFVLSQGVLEYFRKHLSLTTRETLTARMISSALRGLSMREEQSQGFVLPGREAVGRVRWTELDGELLYDSADKTGQVCKRLSDIKDRTLAGQEALKRKEMLEETGHTRAWEIPAADIVQKLQPLPTEQVPAPILPSKIWINIVPSKHSHSKDNNPFPNR